MKRFRFLWWTYTVRGKDFNFVEVESRFGLRTVHSLGRWVTTSIIAIILLTLFALPFILLFLDTGHPAAVLPGAMFLILAAVELGLLIWSLTPPRTSG